MEYNTIRRTAGIEEHQRTLAELDEARQEVEDLLRRRDEVQESWLRVEQDWIISGALQGRKIEKLTARVLELEANNQNAWNSQRIAVDERDARTKQMRKLKVGLDEAIEELDSALEEIIRLTAQNEEYEVEFRKWTLLQPKISSRYSRDRETIAGLVAEVSGLKAQLRQARSKSVEIPY